jgi:hypothetical protein
MAQPSLTTEEQAAVNEVAQRKKTHEDFTVTIRRTWDELYGHYRGLKTLNSNLQQASPPDKDTLLRDFSNEWGSDLVIPFAFSTVETILPRAVSNRPRMLILPRDEDAERNVENMRYLIEQQQQRVQYEMRLEETAKDGFIFGLGVQKLYWETRFGERTQMTQRLMADPQTGQVKPMWVEGDPAQEKIVDDWCVERIPLQNWLWDPFGYFFGDFGESGACQWAIHRTFRNHRYVLDRLRSKAWSTLAAQQLEEDDITRINSTGKWGEAFQTQNRVAGYSSSPQGEELHEVLEFHDGERVITVLDGQIPVVMGKNPERHKQMPFSVFRPSTAGNNQLPGIGAIEPIEQLLREMSTLRSQRRDNAALKLAQVFAYSDGAVDVGDLQFFPGAAIPIHGEPRDFLYPVQVGDIPNSSYNEEDRIVQDIERTTGISDSVTGANSASGAAGTATGVQLVQAAANIRIQRQTQRLEVELVARQAAQAVALNQRKVVERQLFVPDPLAASRPGEMGPIWQRVQLSPAELAGRFAVDVEGGSIAPKNMPQQIQLAQSMAQDIGQDPHIDQRALLRRRLELYGFSHPEAYMVPDTEPLNPDILDRLTEARPDLKGLIEAAVAASQRENQSEGRGEASQQEPQPEQPQNGVAA